MIQNIMNGISGNYYKSNNMKTKGKKRVLKWFLKSTTLHGFKYLASSCSFDRIAWAVWSCVGTFCAAVLCSVLWVRFQEAPTTVILRNSASMNPFDRVPLVAICPSPYHTAQDFAKNLAINKKETKWLTNVFSKILRQKPTADEDRLLLDQLLHERNLTFYAALLKSQAPCKELLQRCRLGRSLLPCLEIYRNQLTVWGSCCVLGINETSEKLKNKRSIGRTTLNWQITINCENKSKTDSHCSELLVKYPAEEWLGPYYLMTGYSYAARLIFDSITDPIKEKLVNEQCVSQNLYSHTRCKIKCKESECGCHHPLRRVLPDFEPNLPPPCTVMQMKCLGNIFSENQLCNCPPACERISASLTLDTAALINSTVSYDNYYRGVNSDSSVVVSFRLLMGRSKSHELIPTQSWLTLLSSLGGVFNMFMGVGLFSILECLVFIYKLNL